MQSNDAMKETPLTGRGGMGTEHETLGPQWDPDDVGSLAENDGAGLMLLQGVIVRELLLELSHEAAQRAAGRIRQRIAAMVRVVTFKDAEDELAAAGLVQMLRLIEADAPPRPA